MNVVVATQPAVNFQSTKAAVIKGIRAIKESGRDVELYFYSKTRFDEAVVLLNHYSLNHDLTSMTISKEDIVSITITQN